MIASSGYLAAGLLLLTPNLHAVTNDLSATLSKGLFEEEANHNLSAAIQMYQSVIDRFDTDRKLAATAVFRLGECYREQGNTNEANAQYQRILREFVDQTPLVTLSGQNLSALGAPAAAQSGQRPADRAVNGLESPVAIADASELSRVEAIIKDSPDLINAPDPSGLTLLQNYAAKGDLAVVKLLLDRGAAANGMKQPDLTPLHYAAGNGHKSVVELLLSKGAKADVKTGSGVTPLHIAVLKGYELVAKILLDAGASVNATVTKDASGSTLSYDFRTGETALHIACWGGYHSLVELLIAKGANVNTEQAPRLNESSGWFTPLSTAVQLSDGPLVKTLLAAHADPNAGMNPALNLAAGGGNLSILEDLLASGANPNTNRPPPLVLAIAAKSPEAVKMLIRFKANPNFREESSGSPVLSRALMDPPILQALLEGGANPNLASASGPSLLEQAAGGEGTGSAAVLLLKYGANVKVQDQSRNTPLYYAVAQCNRELVDALLSKGADPNLSNNSDETPLALNERILAPPRVGAPPTTIGPHESSAERARIEELLVQHGAVADLPRMDRIEVRRPSAKYSSTVFFRGTNDVNHFTLLELVAAHYGFVSLPIYPFIQPSGYDLFSRTIRGSLAFPILDKIQIRRAKPGGKEWTRIPVSVQSILDSGDCSHDVRLEWGDQVEIPEADHALNVFWPGFAPETMAKLQNCLKRQVQLTVKGETTNLVLQIRMSSDPNSLIRDAPPQFCLLPAVQNSGLLRASSDLSRLKVIRHNPSTGENWEKVLDCSGSQPFPNLWLRDGDIIDVPDKP